MSRTMRAAILVSVLFALCAPVMATDDAGKDLYDKKCAMCHGKDGVAKKMAEGSANLNDAEWQAANSADAIAKVTAEGKGKMKGYEGKLSDEELKLVAEYVKTLK
jgi:cytochrome c6